MAGHDQSGTDATNDKWATYYARLEGRPPRPLFQRLRSIYRSDGTARNAVDLGCGDGTETRAMLDDGLAVTAIDGSATAIHLIRERAGASTELTAVQARLEATKVPPADVIYSGLALPFCHPDPFRSVWARVREALRPGGVLAAHFFGDHHGWSSNQEMTFVSADQVQDLLAGLTVLELHESDETKASVSGDIVRMHIFSVIARSGVTQ